LVTVFFAVVVRFADGLAACVAGVVLREDGRLAIGSVVVGDRAAIPDQM
jgi:hypothetical protein